MEDRLLWARIDAAGCETSPGAEAETAWWSVTKTAIAATALRMAGAGLIDLAAPLERLEARGATLGELLGHRGRIASYSDLADYARAVADGGPAWPRDAMLARVMSLPRPGPWAYSNTGFALARAALEQAGGADLGALFATWLFEPLGLDRVRLARNRAEMEALAFPARDYDPGWVYHGCLIGPPAAAARMMAGILDGPVLSAAERATLTGFHRVPDGLARPPWALAGYGLGLMTGAMGARGRLTRALGHSGEGPGSAAAVYHFPRLAHRPTLAVFGPRSGLETAALALARRAAAG